MLKGGLLDLHNIRKIKLIQMKRIKLLSKLRKRSPKKTKLKLSKRLYNPLWLIILLQSPYLVIIRNKAIQGMMRQTLK